MAWMPERTDVAMLAGHAGVFAEARAIFAADPGIAWDFLASKDEARVYEGIHLVDEDTSDRDGPWTVASREFNFWVPASGCPWSPGDTPIVMARGPRADFLGNCLVAAVRPAPFEMRALTLATNGPFLVAPRRGQEVGRVVIGPDDM